MMEYRFASLKRRTLAYLIDILPITFLTFSFFYLFTDFKDVWHQYLSHSRTIMDTIEFQTWKMLIRNTTFIAFVLYGTLFESSKLQGTLGKYILGIKVVNYQFEKISIVHSIYRNFVKLTAYITALISYFMLIFTKNKQTLHDKVSKTYLVVETPPVVFKPKEQVRS